jgi:hypothetical protein
MHVVLLRTHTERPCCCRRAANRGNEFSPSDGDCHVTLDGDHAFNGGDGITL